MSRNSKIRSKENLTKRKEFGEVNKLRNSVNTANILNKSRLGELTKDSCSEDEDPPTEIPDSRSLRMLKPKLHEKTHFKAATALFMQNIGSLQLADHTAKDQVIQAFENAGAQFDMADNYEKFRSRNNYGASAANIEVLTEDGEVISDCNSARMTEGQEEPPKGKHKLSLRDINP